MAIVGIVIWVCMLLQFSIQIDSSELLEFFKSPDANSEESIYLDDRQPNVILDALSQTSRYVYFLVRSPLSTQYARFDCKTAPRPSSAAALKEIRLCCREDTTKSAQCHRLEGMPRQGIVNCGKLNVKYTLWSREGASFNISFAPSTERPVAYNGLISCALSDGEAVIESNEIEFRDALFYVDQLNTQSSNNVLLRPSPLPPTDFPLKFECGTDFATKMKDWPSWMTAVWQKVVPFEWAFCSVEDGTAPAGCASASTPVNVGEGITTMYGSFYLLNAQYLRSHSNSAIVCRQRNSLNPIVIYASAVKGDSPPKITSGFSIDDNASPSVENSDRLVALSPQSLHFEFLDGTILNNFQLQAFYRRPAGAAVESTSAVWYKDGQQLSDAGVQDYALRLPDKVSRAIAGEYKLEVTNPNSPALTFVFNIAVIGPPKFQNVDCMDDLFYVMEGDTYRTECNINPGSSAVKVGVNGIEGQTTQDLRRRLSNALDLANKPISQLEIDFSVTGDDKQGRKVVVSVGPLKPSQNFRLSIKAANGNGQSQVAGTIRVVPKPSLTTSPSDFSCASACDQEPFFVRCVLDKAVSVKWSNTFGILADQGWLLNRMWTLEEIFKDSQLAPYFQFDPADPTRIGVSPLEPFPKMPTTTTTTTSTTNGLSTGSSEHNQPSSESYTSSPGTLKQLLSSRTSRQVDSLSLECRVRLFVNNSRAAFHPARGDDSALAPTLLLDRKRREALSDSRKIYDSMYEQDAELSKTLTATRSLSTEPVEPALANLSWILAVVISIIIVLAVIALSVWLCTRDRGESYNAYRKELKIGNDPLLELKDNKSFQPFERPEGPPVPANRYSLNGDSVDVGSDEDGELDGYNTDIGTFNEEASYIGAYSKNAGIPHTTYATKMPPHSDHHTAV
uniref:Neurofascin/L1/NrCAM C-terminal domain-containing protein n=1 Tax=Schistocephalus solidus TaxID=70667 RepID=A0A0X3P492_SCHSO